MKRAVEGASFFLEFLVCAVVGCGLAAAMLLLNGFLHVAGLK